VTIKGVLLFILNPLIKVVRKHKGRERFISYGTDNSDKKFYVIGFNDQLGGLSWFIHRVLMHIGYAIDRGYIPIVDMQNYISQYLEMEKLHKENAWEYYFEQPFGITLQDIENSKNIIISRKTPSPRGEYFMGHFYNDKKRIAYFRGLFKKYIIINKTTQDYLASEYEKILKNKGKVLGILCRGTDYLLNQPSNHPVQPDPLDVIKKAEEAVIENNCSYIFLATEDENIYACFREHFREKLLVNQQRRISHNEMTNISGVAIARSKIIREKNSYLSGLEYLSAINLLSKCSCFIGGRTGGTKAVLLMSDGFEYEYIYDLGYYK
jgi:hypothetical protein